jgi:hypothetical protein
VCAALIADGYGGFAHVKTGNWERSSMHELREKRGKEVPAKRILEELFLS